MTAKTNHTLYLESRKSLRKDMKFETCWVESGLLRYSLGMGRACNTLLRNKVYVVRCANLKDALWNLGIFNLGYIYRTPGRSLFMNPPNILCAPVLESPVLGGKHILASATQYNPFKYLQNILFKKLREWAWNKEDNVEWGQGKIKRSCRAS